MKSLRIFGIYVGSKAMQSRFHDALSKHSIKPVINCVVEFDQAAILMSIRSQAATLARLL